MRMLARLTFAAILAFGTAVAPTAATEKNAKLSDLTKMGYACKGVGPDRSVCTKKDAPTYGCERNDCVAIRKVGGSVRAPAAGVLDPRVRY